MISEGRSFYYSAASGEWEWDRKGQGSIALMISLVYHLIFLTMCTYYVDNCKRAV